MFKEKTRFTAGLNGRSTEEAQTQGLFQELCGFSHWVGGMPLNNVRNITEVQNERKI